MRGSPTGLPPLDVSRPVELLLVGATLLLLEFSFTCFPSSPFCTSDPSIRSLRRWVFFTLSFLDDVAIWSEVLLHRVVGVNITSGAGLPSMHGACVWESGTKASVWIGPQATKISTAAVAATCVANPAEGNALPPWHSGQVVGLGGGDEQDGRGRRRVRVRVGRGDDGVRIMGRESNK